MAVFEQINRGYNSVFSKGRLSIGLVVPIEFYPHGPVPSMEHHVQRIQFAESLGFKAVWIRDVPFNVPSFGDAGQTYDPFTYMGYLAGLTKDIALGISSIALPLHHPANVAKAAFSIDQLSGGRFILGVASGDRHDEYPAMGKSYEGRGKLFREAFEYIRRMSESFPVMEKNVFGETSGRTDMLPKPTAHKIPMLITGYSQQSLDWNAEHGDGWMNYPRNLVHQKNTIAQWRGLVSQSQQYDRPYMQPLYVILEENPDFTPIPIQLGFRLGVNYLREYLNEISAMGVNHIALNLRFNHLDMEETIHRIASEVLPEFHSAANNTIKT